MIFLVGFVTTGRFSIAAAVYMRKILYNLIAANRKEQRGEEKKERGGERDRQDMERNVST